MKRSITLSGHRTSISLEEPFWLALREISAQKGVTPTEIIGEIDAARLPDDNLSSAIRIFILRHYQAKTA